MFAAFHRSSFLAAVTLSLGVAAVAAGCSGAVTPDVLSGAPSSETASSGAAGTSGGASGTSGSSGATSGGATSSGSNGTSGGAACATPETEPNDDQEHANVIQPMRCGTVGGGDSKDDLTFELGNRISNLKIIFHGDVQLKVTVNQKTVTITPQTQEQVNVVRGQPYLIEITSLAGGGAATPWDVTIEAS
jgi:hypothetical protein